MCRTHLTDYCCFAEHPYPGSLCSGLRRDPGSELYFLDVESKGFTLLTRAAAAGDADRVRVLIEVS